MLVPYDGKATDTLTVPFPRCESSKTLRGGDCDLRGEVVFYGLLMCERHAKQMGAQDRVGLLEGIVSTLGLCLRSIPLRKHKDLSAMVRVQHAQATRELAQAYEDLRRATGYCSS